MSKSFFEKNPKLATAILSLTIIAIFLFLLITVLRFRIFQDYEGGEKYSLIDSAIYKIRCNGDRNIRLRELRPNYNYTRIPAEKFETLEHKEYSLRVDHDGMIQPSFVHKNPDLQIFFLGGSTTECEHVDENFRFPYLAGRLLEEKLKIKVNSDNAAKSGNNSLHSIDIMINKLLPYNPDVIVMMHNINDLSALVHEGTYWNDNKTIAPISCGKKNTSKLRKHDQWVSSEWQDKILHDEAEQKKLVKLFKENLKLFIYIAKAKNITPVLMTQENRIENNDDFASGRGKDFDKVYKKLYREFNETIRETAREENVIMVDLAKKIPSDKKYIYDVVHYNKEGSVMAANEVARVLAANLKINKKNK